MVGWLAGWLVGWMAGWLVAGGLVGWLAGLGYWFRYIDVVNRRMSMIDRVEYTRFDYVISVSS